MILIFFNVLLKLIPKPTVSLPSRSHHEDAKRISVFWRDLNGKSKTVIKRDQILCTRSSYETFVKSLCQPSGKFIYNFLEIANDDQSHVPWQVSHGDIDIIKLERSLAVLAESFVPFT